MNISRKRVVLVCLILMHLLVASCCSVIAFLWMPDTEVFGGVFLGTVFAQGSLLAVWIALGRGAFTGRCLLVFLLLTTSGTLLMLPIACESDGWSFALAFGAILLGQWLAVQTPLWLIRLVFGWRIGLLDTVADDSGRDELQFGIKQLLGWTAAVAALLGIGRLLAGDELRDPETAWEMVAFALVLAGGNVMVAWPMIWAMLVRRWVPVWTAVALAIAVVITLEEPNVFSRVTRGSADAEVFWWINGVHIAWVYLSLVAIRLCGYRMEQR
ncbi:MAG: hypothetical protein H8E44_10525 [Planctomycetes bacterium]|nr:hypothetical protein [Planctomycetota bacterium]